MSLPEPDPIDSAEHRQRWRRVHGIAKRLGFEGKVEYRHVYSGTGGAQYGKGSKNAADLLAVFAEAFDRDANPEDYSLEAIIAHECGHQLLSRHPRLARQVSAETSDVTHEILASLLGSLLVNDDRDREALFLKALAEVCENGMPTSKGLTFLNELRNMLEKFL